MPRGRHIGAALAVCGLAMAAGAPFCSTEEPGLPALQFRRSREIRLRANHPDTIAPVVQYTLYVTETEGATWHSAAAGEFRQTDSEFRYSAPADGRYGFRIAARDAAGHENEPPAPGTPPEVLVAIDTVPPVVQLRDPLDRATLKQGAPLTVRWEVNDANPDAHGVQIMAAYDGTGAAVVAAAQPPSGSCVLHPPAEATRLIVTAVAVDLAGNRSESKPVTVTLSSTGYAQSTVAPPPAPEIPADVPRPGWDIFYKIESDAPSGLREVNLWYTLDEGTAWQLYGRDEDLVPPFHFVPSRPGKYGFYVVAVKRTGQASTADPLPGTKPQFSQIFDPVPPVVTLLSPRDGAGRPMRGGEPVEIRWSAADDLFGDKPITLWYTTKPPKWEPIVADGLPNSGSFTWILPKIDTDSLFLKVTAVDLAGNVTESEPSGPLSLDSQGPPVVKPTGVITRGHVGGRDAAGRDPRTLGTAELARMEYEQGLVWMKVERDPMKAEAAFERALRLQPNFVEALNDLAVLYYANGLYGKAVETCIRSKAADGSHPRVMLNLAMCYRRVGRIDDALSELEAICALPEISPSDSAEAGTLLLELARDFLRRQNASQGRRAAGLAAGLVSAPPDLIKTARAYLQ